MPSSPSPAAESLSAQVAMPNAADNQDVSPLPAPNAHLGRMLRQGVGAMWDKLGLVVGASLTWTLLLSTALSLERLVPRQSPLPIHIGFVAVALLLLLSAPLGGLFHVAHQIATRDELSYGAFWQGGLRLYRHVLTLAACDLLVAGVLGVNCRFYGRVGHVGGLAVMLLCLYLLLFWSLMAAYHFPLLIAQEAGVFDEPNKPTRRGTLAVLRRAFFLVLGRPFYALGLLTALFLLTVVCSATGILFALLWPAGLALLATYAARGLLVQYGVLPPPLPDEPVIPDEKFRIQKG